MKGLPPRATRRRGVSKPPSATVLVVEEIKVRARNGKKSPPPPPRRQNFSVGEGDNSGHFLRKPRERESSRFGKVPEQEAERVEEEDRQ